MCALQREMEAREGGETYCDEIGREASSSASLALGKRGGLDEVPVGHAVGRLVLLGNQGDRGSVHVLLEVKVEKLEHEAQPRVGVDDVEQPEPSARVGDGGART